MKKTRRVIALLISIVLIAGLFAACGKKEAEPVTQDAETAAPTTAVTTTEVTTEEPTTAKKTADEAIRETLETMKSGEFFMAGTMEMSGRKMGLTVTADGKNSGVDITGSGMNISILYYEEASYIVNRNTSKYAKITKESIQSITNSLGTLSGLGFTMSDSDLNGLESMMDSFDGNSMDYSKYMEDAEHDVYEAERDGQKLTCASYKNDQGTLRVYLDEEDLSLKYVEVYANGVRQMDLTVQRFVPAVAAPVTLNGLRAASTITDLFTNT